MPEGLEIDRTKPLNGSIPQYAEQVLICTGERDWPSKIEEEKGGDNLAADLKELLGRGGIYSDPFHNISITNASFPSSVPRRSEVQTASAYLFPSFKYVPFIPRASFDSVQALVKGYILPKKLHSAHDSLSPIHKDRLRRSDAYQSALYGVQDVTDIMVLICGHGGRDGRCGVMGPVLEEEFKQKLGKQGIEVLEGSVPIDEGQGSQGRIAGSSTPSSKPTARTGLISHIGGHKYAGNVIIYIPPTAKTPSGKSHPLAGCGIWYGRVEPKHVEGIISKTILDGIVLEDLFRGGITQESKVFWRL